MTERWLRIVLGSFNLERVRESWYFRDQGKEFQVVCLFLMKKENLSKANTLFKITAYRKTCTICL